MLVNKRATKRTSAAAGRSALKKRAKSLQPTPAADVLIVAGDSDSDEQSTDAQEVTLCVEYERSLDQRTRDTARAKQLRDSVPASPVTFVNMDDFALVYGAQDAQSAQAITGEGVDASLCANAVFNLRAERALVAAAHEARHDKARVEPLSDVCLLAMRDCIGAAGGESERHTFERVAHELQDKLGRPIDYTDVGSLFTAVRCALKENKTRGGSVHDVGGGTGGLSSAAAADKSSWSEQISDSALVELTPHTTRLRAQVADVRARIESTSVEEYERAAPSVRSMSVDEAFAALKAETAANIEQQLHQQSVIKLIDPLSRLPVRPMDEPAPPPPQPPPVPLVTARSTRIECVSADQVASIECSSSEAPSAVAAHVTTPPEGSEQHTAFTQSLDKLERTDGVIVSAATRRAKLATCVPPAVPVQGKLVLGTEGTPVYGDGNVVRSAVDYLVDRINDHSMTPDELCKLSIEEMTMRVKSVIDTYHTLPSVMPDDARDMFDERAALRILEDALHAFVNRARASERTTMAQFIEEQLALLPRTASLDELRQRVATFGDQHVGAVVDAAMLLKKQRDTKGAAHAAPVNVVTSDDVTHAAKQAMNEHWLADDANVQRALQPHLTDDDVQLITTSFGANPSTHAFLKQLGESLELKLYNEQQQQQQMQTATTGGDTSSDTAALFTENGRLRDKSLINHTPGSEHIVNELNELVSDFTMSNYLQTLCTERTRDIRRLEATVKRLEAKASDSTLTLAESHDLEEARAELQAVERSARHESALSKKLGHKHAESALAEMQRRAAADLEVVSRAHIQRYLHKPLPSCAHTQRPCVSDNRCLCVIMAASMAHKRGFVCREFLTPDMERRLRQSGTLPRERQFCYVCHLYHTCTAFYQLSRRGDDGATMMILQPFRVIFGQSGEYDETEVGNLCIVGTHMNGIVAPFPAFNARNYDYSTCRVEDEDGVMHDNVPCLVEMDDAVFH